MHIGRSCLRAPRAVPVLWQTGLPHLLLLNQHVPCPSRQLSAASNAPPAPHTRSNTGRKGGVGTRTSVGQGVLTRLNAVAASGSLALRQGAQVTRTMRADAG
jgi:hypothetical protein